MAESSVPGAAPRIPRTPTEGQCPYCGNRWMVGMEGTPEGWPCGHGPESEKKPGGAVGEREEPLDRTKDALLSVLTVCGLEGQDPPNTLLAFQMIRDFARPAYDAIVEVENADD